MPEDAVDAATKPDDAEAMPSDAQPAQTDAQAPTESAPKRKLSKSKASAMAKARWANIKRSADRAVRKLKGKTVEAEDEESVPKRSIKPRPRSAEPRETHAPPSRFKLELPKLTEDEKQTVLYVVLGIVAAIFVIGLIYTLRKMKQAAPPAPPTKPPAPPRVPAGAAMEPKSAFDVTDADASGAGVLPEESPFARFGRE